MPSGDRQSRTLRTTFRRLLDADGSSGLQLSLVHRIRGAGSAACRPTGCALPGLTFLTGMFCPRVRTFQHHPGTGTAALPIQGTVSGRPSCPARPEATPSASGRSPAAVAAGPSRTEKASRTGGGGTRAALPISAHRAFKPLNPHSDPTPHVPTHPPPDRTTSHAARRASPTHAARHLKPLAAPPHRTIGHTRARLPPPPPSPRGLHAARRAPNPPHRTTSHTRATPEHHKSTSSPTSSAPHSQK